VLIDQEPALEFFHNELGHHLLELVGPDGHAHAVERRRVDHIVDFKGHLHLFAFL